MKIKKVLIVYKKSSYEQHALDERDPNYLRLLREKSAATRASRKIHREHRATFESVKRDLKRIGLRFDVRLRYRLRPIDRYDLVVTIGGDGTFLETAHYLMSGIILGVNSVPSESVGYYCRSNRNNFRRKILQLLRGQARLQRLHRLCVRLPRYGSLPFVLNDILFTSRNPAGTTRYCLSTGRGREEQKSSGIWISPAAGSTAAIGSAGGKVLPLSSRKFQYLVREPYRPRGKQFRLLRGLLSPKQSIRILSIMDEACVYLDGPHAAYPVRRGDLVVIRPANRPLDVVW